MSSRDVEEPAMITTSIRTTAGTRARGLVALAFAAAMAAGATPAAAAPEEGTPTAPTECAARVQWGWPNGADGPAYFGQRFGVFLPPQCRGPVLEGLDP
jgi:hypothetical protein